MQLSTILSVLLATAVVANPLANPVAEAEPAGITAAPEAHEIREAYEDATGAKCPSKLCLSKANKVQSCAVCLSCTFRPPVSPPRVAYCNTHLFPERLHLLRSQGGRVRHRDDQHPVPVQIVLGHQCPGAKLRHQQVRSCHRHFGAIRGLQRVCVPEEPPVHLVRRLEGVFTTGWSGAKAGLALGVVLRPPDEECDGMRQRRCIYRYLQHT